MFALWVRSYVASDILKVSISRTQSFKIISLDGQFLIWNLDSPGSPWAKGQGVPQAVFKPAGVTPFSEEFLQAESARQLKVYRIFVKKYEVGLGFGGLHSFGAWFMPYWFPTAATAIIAGSVDKMAIRTSHILHRHHCSRGASRNNRGFDVRTFVLPKLVDSRFLAGYDTCVQSQSRPAIASWFSWATNQEYWVWRQDNAAGATCNRGAIAVMTTAVKAGVLAESLIFGARFVRFCARRFTQDSVHSGPVLTL